MQRNASSEMIPVVSTYYVLNQLAGLYPEAYDFLKQDFERPIHRELIAAEPIRIWFDYSQAPAQYQLSKFGGDEEGVAFIPNGQEIPFKLERLWNEFIDPPQIEELPEGRVVIWAHG